MPLLSAVIIAYNEQEQIGSCLESLQGVADEIIVVDSFSTDSTEEICASYNVRFIKHEFEGYLEHKNYATSLATYPLVISLDADEALSDELRKSILRAKESDGYDGYRFNRRHNYCGKWMKHSRLYPDRQLRLFNPRKGKWIGPNPHDKFRLYAGSRTGLLKGDLLHWYYSSFEEHLEKGNRFSSIAAGEYFKAGRKADPFTAHLHLVWSFVRSFVFYAGFHDGYTGYVCCSINAWTSFLKYAKLRRMNLEARRYGKDK